MVVATLQLPPSAVVRCKETAILPQRQDSQTTFPLQNKSCTERILRHYRNELQKHKKKINPNHSLFQFLLGFPFIFSEFKHTVKCHEFIGLFQ